MNIDDLVHILSADPALVEVNGRSGAICGQSVGRLNGRPHTWWGVNVDGVVWMVSEHDLRLLDMPDTSTAA